MTDKITKKETTCSFDVFDTVLARSTGTPGGIFDRMQETIMISDAFQELPEFIRDNFAVIRRLGGELAARSVCYWSDREEATLREIYECVNCVERLSDMLLQRLMELERETELACVVPIKENVERITSLREEGQRVLLISDMYLEKETIRRMLAKACPSLSDIPLYVSSEYKKNKVSGELFRIIHEQEQIAYDLWFHTGDNPISDYEVPKRLGIHARIYRHKAAGAVPEQADEKLYRAARDKTTRAIKRAGAAGTPATPYEIGAAVGGPILYSYTAWMLEECRKKGIRRLYFIARDGYILKQIAEILIRERKLDIRTKYLYGSRKAWRMPAIGEANCHVSDMIRWSYSDKVDSIEELARMFGLRGEELYPFLPEGLRPAPDTGLPYACIRSVLKKLEMNPEFERFLTERHAPGRRLVMEYLQQEIDMSDDRFAFVELGGNGFTQACLGHILRPVFPGPIKNFYFKMEFLNLFSNCENFVFFPSALPYHLIMEMICRAPHGQTLGYERKAGRVVPVLDDREANAYAEHGYAEYIDGILAYCAEASAAAKHEKGERISLKLVAQWMEFAGKHPTKEVLDFFADMPNSLSGRENAPEVYAPKLSEEDLKNIFYYGQGKPLYQYYHGSDLDYSMLRATPEQVGLAEHYKNTPYKPDRPQRKDYSFIPCRVIIYGAGKKGVLLYRSLKAEGKHEIQAWLDSNGGGTVEGRPVELPEAILRKEFDVVLVAIANERAYHAVHDRLCNIGVEAGKIWWFFE